MHLQGNYENCGKDNTGPASSWSVTYLIVIGVFSSIGVAGVKNATFRRAHVSFVATH
jgi:hypothetical protein